MGGLGSFLFGSSGKVSQQNLMTPEQMQALRAFLGSGGVSESPLYQQGASYLMNLLNPSQQSLDQFNQPYLDQFNEEIVPGIAERFAGLGGLSSSALNQTLAQAGKGLAMQLGNNRQQMQFQGLPLALGYASEPYQHLLSAISARPFENIYKPGSSGLLGGILGGAGSAFGSSFGNKLGGKFFG